MIIQSLIKKAGITADASSIAGALEEATRTEMISDNKAQVRLYYYDFDKNEIINNMMSFGTTVKIISPNEMIDTLKKRLYQNIE